MFSVMFCIVLFIVVEVVILVVLIGSDVVFFVSVVVFCGVKVLLMLSML